MIRKKVSGNIVHTGNTVADTVKTALQMIGMGFKKKEFLLAAIHRQENIFNWFTLKRVIKILDSVRKPPILAT